jgi:hypothetical protein
MNRNKLRIVADEPEVADIYTAWKAEIASKDWRQVHVRSDRSEPVELVEGNRGKWR